MADLGIDDETNGGGSVVFQVLADGVSIYTSSTILGTTPILPLTLDVTGVNTLTLNVNQSTNNKTDDHADWANARLLFTPPTPPAAPSGLTATALSTTQIRINWTDNANNETGFQIDRSPNGTSGWTQIATVGNNIVTYTNTGLTTGTAYYYRVRATNAGGTSADSNVATATTLVTLPTAPSGLTATALSATEIRLNWTDASNNETGFQIDRSPNGTSGWTQSARSTPMWRLTPTRDCRRRPRTIIVFAPKLCRQLGKQQRGQRHDAGHAAGGAVILVGHDAFLVTDSAELDRQRQQRDRLPDRPLGQRHHRLDADRHGRQQRW